ncbi:MAG: protein kinase [Acidobacteria bacterium]|nr:protein kinase [Acidobacteriota bacterium]
MTGLKNFIGTKRFTIKRRLGAGSFGVVYEAFDQETNSIVALKVLHQGLFQESGEALYRFKREFRALADVTHPNLISLYELISNGEEWFFTMELVKGINFLDYVREQEIGNNRSASISASVSASVSTKNALTKQTIVSDIDCPTIEASTSELNDSPKHTLETIDYANATPTSPPPLSINRLRLVFRQLAEGVYALHKVGKLHRDIKPSNVLVTSDGRVVILDFGLVTELNPELDIHTSFGFLGTPTHMSPEQSACLPVSEASDWYSVGVILYQALTGRLPFLGKMEQIINQRLEQDPPSPISLIETIPKDLNDLCMSLLHRDAKKRPEGKEIISQLRGTTRELPANLLVLPFPQNTTNTNSLIGRDAQIASLKSAFGLTQKGQAVLVYLHGSSGMGKSALVREFLAQIQNTDAVILTGRCYEQEAVPYKAVDSLIDALSQYLKNLPILESEVLMPRDILVLSRLFPVLSQVHSVASTRRKNLEIPDSQELRRRAFSALRELFGRLADRKSVVLFIDDLHWGDLDSVSLLQELFQPPDPPPLLLIVSYRTEEIESSSVVKELLKLRTTNNSSFTSLEISLPELSIEESEKLALALLDNHYHPNKIALSFIAQEAAGSPFFLSELIRYFQSTNYDIKRFSSGQIPVLDSSTEPLATEILPVTKLMSVDEMLSVRIAQLPDHIRSLLEIIAVAGRPFSWAITKKAANLETDDRVILAILRTQHFIRVRETENQEKVEIYHDRIRENIVNNLSIEKLKNYHLSLGKVLEAEQYTDPETLASHFLGAHQFEKAAQYTGVAADKAYQLLAFDQAARLYQLVLGLEPKEKNNKNLWQRLANSLANSGRSLEAAKAYLTAAQLETNEADFIQLQRIAAEKYLISGHMDEGLEVLRTFLSRVGLTLPATPKRALLSFLYKRAQIWWRGLKFQERDETSISKEELMRIDTCWAGSIGLGIVDTTLGADFQARHLLLALNAGEPYRVVRALAMEAGYSATSGGPNRLQAEEYVQVALEMATKLNQPHAIGLTKMMASLAAFLTGQWSKCCEFALEADEILRENCTGATWEINTGLFFRVRALFWLGELNELTNLLPTHLKLAKAQGDLLTLVNLQTRAAYILDIANDEPECAKMELEKTLSQWSNKYFHIQHFQGWVAETEIALYQNKANQAWEIFQAKWPQITSSLFLRIQYLLIEALHLNVRVIIALAIIEKDPANFHILLTTLEQKIKQLEQEKMDYSIALALPARAALAVLRGNKNLAIEFLEQAQEKFKTQKMSLYLEATKYQLGLLTSNLDLVNSAEKWMKEQKIKNPFAITNMFLPGFVDINEP